MNEPESDRAQCPICEGTGLDPMSIVSEGVPRPCGYCGGEGVVTAKEEEAVSAEGRSGCLGFLMLPLVVLLGGLFRSDG